MLNHTQQKRRYLIATLAVTIALLSLDLLFPLSWDNEIFQSMAMDLIRFGRLPFLGSWAHDFPGTVYIHWFSIVLFGNSAFGFRLFDFTLHLGMAWMFFSLLCRWLAPRTSFLAVALYMLHYISNGFNMAGQRDAFAIAFLLTGTLLLLAATDRPERSTTQYLMVIGSGIALTMMFTFRATYGIFAVVGFAFFLLHEKDRVSLAISYLAGVSCVLLALVIPYAIRNGGLEQVYLITVRYNLDIYGIIRSPLKMALKEFGIRKIFFVPGFLGLLLAFRSSLRIPLRVQRVWKRIRIPSSKQQWLFIGYGLSGLLSLLVMGKFLPYHFEPLILVLSPFAALGIESLIAAVPRTPWKIAAIAVIVIYSLLRVYPLYIARPFAHAILNGQPLEVPQNAMTSVEAGFRNNIDAAVAAYIDRTAPPSEYVACATLTAGIRWRTSHPCVSRFTTFYPLSMYAPNGTHPDFQQTWRREFLDSLIVDKPYYIVLGNGPAEIVDWVHKTPAQSIHEIEGFDSLILPNYRADTVIGGYSILMRKG